MLKDSLLQIREFEDYDPNIYHTINIAWPVEVFECAASKKMSKELDCLAEAVLKFIDIGVCDTKEIANTLHISPDLAQHIKHNLYERYEFIDESLEKLTDNGKQFFRKSDKIRFSDKKVFGYMLQSLFDGDIMPYFIKGQMPLIGGFPTDVVKLKLPHDDEDFFYNVTEKNDALFTEAYKKYCRIYESSKDISAEEELDYLRSECIDVSFEDVDDDSQITTLSDKLKEEEILNGQVEILNPLGQQMYVLTQLVINKYSPEDMQVISPFSINITTWYNKKLTFFLTKDNDINVTSSDGTVCSFTDFISVELEKIAFEMPEIQMDNYVYYLQANFPLLNKAPKLKSNIELIIKEYYSCAQRFEQERFGGVYVVSSGSVLIETLLNNFIVKIENRTPIVNTNIFGYRDIETSQIDRLFNKFSINNCRAKSSTPYFLKEMSDPRRGWDKPNRVGNSITTRYFFLILEAFLIGKNPFKKVLNMDAQKVVDAFDYITNMRNTNSAHNDKESYNNIPDKSVNMFIENNLYLSKLMVAVLAEEEIENGKKKKE